MTEYERLKAQRTEIELRQESQKDNRIRMLEEQHETLSRLLDAERDKVSKLEAENAELMGKNDEEFSGMDSDNRQLKAENAALKAELNAVDLALVRRDALDGIPHRYDKILKCIEVAKQADGLRAKLERAEKALKDIAERCDEPFGYASRYFEESK